MNLLFLPYLYEIGNDDWKVSLGIVDADDGNF
jgi:hypothetical protein